MPATGQEKPFTRTWLATALVATPVMAVVLAVLFSLVALPVRHLLGVDGLAAARLLAAVVALAASLALVRHELKRTAEVHGLAVPWRMTVRVVGTAGLPLTAGLLIALFAALRAPEGQGLLHSWARLLPTGALAAAFVGAAMAVAERFTPLGRARWLALAASVALALAAVRAGYVVRGAVEPHAQAPWETTGEPPRPP